MTATLALIPAMDRADLMHRIEPVITAHETGSFLAAVIDAASRYGQYRQLGQPHETAAATVEQIVKTWYGVAPWPS